MRLAVLSLAIGHNDAGARDAVELRAGPGA